MLKSLFFYRPSQYKTKFCDSGLLKEKTVACKICGKLFANFNQKNYHSRRKHRDATMKCTRCDRVLFSRQSYNEHMLSQHIPDKRKHECLVCNKRFVTNRRMRMHIQGVHEGYREFHCDQCEKCYSARYRLLEHIRVVHEDR